MSALPFAMLAQIALSCSAASSLPKGQLVDRVLATAQAESGLQTTALHDNATNQAYFPTTNAEAIALATMLRQLGHSVDAGLMQINDKNWQRLGLTAESVFDPQRNVCAGVMVLAEAYAIERRVSCRYNTGRPDCANGYPERIESALSRVRATGAVAVQKIYATPIPSNPFVGHGPVREMVFTPFSHPVAPPPSEARPAVPAVPDSPIAVSDRGRSELVTMWSAER